MGELLGAICVVAFLAFIGYVGFTTGQDDVMYKMQRETVAHGCAAYTMDPATGATAWDWKEKP